MQSKRLSNQRFFLTVFDNPLSVYRNPAEPVFKLSKFAGDTTTIYALNVGGDTFYVDYITQAESPQPKRAPIVVAVKEWKK